jgi:hypothetical protein
MSGLTARIGHEQETDKSGEQKEKLPQYVIRLFSSSRRKPGSIE